MPFSTFLYKNISIAYQDSGKGNTIVFLHGFLENQTMWQRSLENFKTTHRCITIDLFGHGQTSSLGYIHTMEHQADMVLKLIELLNISKFSLVGHSMGGYIALSILEKKPKLVHQLVLLNSSPLADDDERQLNRERAILAVKQNHKVFVSLAVGNLFSENSQSKLSETIESIKQEALGTPQQGIIAALSGMKIRKDRSFLLEKHQSKILMILGKKDPVLNHETHLNLAMQYNINCVSLSEGHMSWVEDFEEMNDTLKSFLE
jgi:pimeloyl-ACP methyl ester carboxylesterase